MEIAAVDPLLLSMTDEPGIKAGMMSVIPHISEEREEYEEPDLPEKTLLCAGQYLERSDYPQLSPHFTEGGGFYSFQLPDLRNKFILGVNEDGDFIMGDGIIYCEDVPDTTPPPRSLLGA